MEFSKILVFGDMENLRGLLRGLRDAGKIFDFASDMAHLKARIPKFRPEIVLVGNSISKSEREEINSILDLYPGAKLKRAKEFVS